MAIPFDISTFPLGTPFVHTSGLKANLQRSPEGQPLLFDENNEYHTFLHNLTSDWKSDLPYWETKHPVTGERCRQYLGKPIKAPITRPAQAEPITAGMDIGKDKIHWEIQQSNRAAEENRKWQKELEEGSYKPNAQQISDTGACGIFGPQDEWANEEEPHSPLISDSLTCASTNRQLISQAEKDIFVILSKLYEETGLVATSLKCHIHGNFPRLHFVEISSLELGPEQ